VSESNAEAVDLVRLDEADVLSQMPLAPWAADAAELGQLIVKVSK
jgi:polysaccharide deacetylase 2 family uncharacterized protein YibQ